jgi:dUTP pyrophosphatase
MNAKITKPIKTPEEAQEAARNMANEIAEAEQKQQSFLEDAINQIKKINPQAGGFEEISAILALPEESFLMLAPHFLLEFEKSFNNLNNQLAMVQAMNLAGVKAEDIEREYLLITSELSKQLEGSMSVQKIDFLKRFLSVSYNAMLQAEGIAKRHILIPIEYCREDAKMPTYAHLSDAGMDIFATEDITIAPGQTVLIPTGLKCALPLGYELQVRPKSGRCLKTKLRVANTPGTIDAGYRDEIGVIIDNIEPFVKSAEIDENGRLYNVEFGSSYTIGKGEKFAQLVLCEVPKAVFYEVDSVAGIGEDRQGGFGSTGVK